jgi:hypothetical protein
MDSNFVVTAAENKLRYTKREIEGATAARQLMAKLGHSSSQATVDILNMGVMNCSVTKEDVRRADDIFGPSVAALKGKTRKMASKSSDLVLIPRVVQVQQVLDVDVFYVKHLGFLLGVLSPLGLSLCVFLKNRGVECMGEAIRSFQSIASSRGFDCRVIQTDGEGAIGAMIPELNRDGIIVQVAGPGQHVPVVERKIQTIKQRVRSFNNDLPFVMTRLLLIMCVLFCVSRVNMQPSSTCVDRASPLEKFTGRKLDAKRDLRVQFGDYVQATVPSTDNTMTARTQGCIAMLPTGNLTGSVKMWCLSTRATVTRDQFVVLPMPEEVCNFVSKVAIGEGYSRALDPTFALDKGDEILEEDLMPMLPEVIAIENRADTVLNDPMIAGESEIQEAAQQPEEITLQEPPQVHELPHSALEAAGGTRRSTRATLGVMPSRYRSLVIHSAADAAREKIQKQQGKLCDEAAFTISVRAALRDRAAEATPVIEAELKQMVAKGVWRGVDTAQLTGPQRRAIIRSSMFLKDKYLASGSFDRFKARLVAGGNQQDKQLYEDLSSPTAATSSVLAVAAIAAAEGRITEVIDIGGAFLNADMASTGVAVHMRLDRIMTGILLKIDPSYHEYVEPRGTMVVVLDKALYGCVEAAALWYKDLRSKLIANDFKENLYDVCVFNKTCDDGEQTTIVLHVDDLMVTSVAQRNLDAFGAYLKTVYPETRTNKGAVLDYIGMTFDFTVSGEVRITMDNCVKDILSGCGVDTVRATPAATTLFDVRETVKATAAETKWFRTYVAKILYLAKRVRPECLTAVAFLSTRVLVCDLDDIAKLKRLLGYLLGTRHRGIVLRVGKHMGVSAYIDAAYGVHLESGKSHTGCAIVLGEAGPVFSKSGKQKIVTKSSTEAELVGLSDTASQAIHLQNFVEAQGYDIGPVVIYQDNKSCMALMKRGTPGSERSRHINIRHFWLSEKVNEKIVVLEHLGTEEMFANILTKPVQGSQFAKERQGLTNWE